MEVEETKLLIHTLYVLYNLIPKKTLKKLTSTLYLKFLCTCILMAYDDVHPFGSNCEEEILDSAFYT